MKKRFQAALLFSVLGSGAAQSGCLSPEARQFDFWLGTWEVQQPDGKVGGTDTVTKTLGGCVLEERWTSVDGNLGVSINAYSALEGQWTQTYMDNAGTVLVLTGGFKGDRMVLQGTQPGQAAGVTVTNRITWFIQAPDRVRQLWEVSRDAGQTWQTVFEGLYIRK